VSISLKGLVRDYSKDFKIYVIELNTFPGFPKERRFNLSKRIIQRIEGKKWN